MLKVAGSVGGGGNGTGTVTQVSTGTGLTGGPITTSGTISLANTAVTAGVYGNNTTVAQITIDSQGRITAASNVGITTGGTGTVTQVSGNGTVNGITLTGTVTSTGNLTLGGTLSNVSLTSQVTGTLPVANGGTGVTVSSGANSVVLRDVNQNITTNAFFAGFTSVAASGTQINLTAASTPVYVVTGSGGQVIKLPDATTLPKGPIFSFNNNQSSGSITVNNNSGTLVASVPSGGYTTIVLLDNATAAGSWDRHDQSPSNVSWSTNTFDYPGSITSATWNGATVTINRGGTGLSNVGNSGNVLTSNGTAWVSQAPTGGGGGTGNVVTNVATITAGTNISWTNATSVVLSWTNNSSNVVTWTNTAYAVTNNNATILVNYPAAPFSVVLPSASTVTGQQYQIKKIDSSSNAVTVSTTSSQTIDGNLTYSLATIYKSVTLQSDGSNYYIFATV